MFSYPRVSKGVIKGQLLPLVPQSGSLGVFSDLGGHAELAFKWTLPPASCKQSFLSPHALVSGKQLIMQGRYED